MTLAQMTEEQKSRWIAEKLEPIDSIPAGAWHADATALFAWTPLRMWKIKDVHDWNNYRGSAEPRDMIHDPTMTLTLMESLISQESPSRAFRLIVEQMTGEHPSLSYKAWSERLRHATVEAWMLASGWTEK